MSATDVKPFWVEIEEFDEDGHLTNKRRITTEELESMFEEEVAVPAYDGPNHEFNRAGNATLERCTAVSNQRGTEYLDTWALENQITTFTVATLRAILGDELTSGLTGDELRLIKNAALIDVKDERMLGGFKEDTIDDGINYRAAYCTWRQSYYERHGR